MSQSYLFIGPPNSGKTVYFACAMDLIQRRASKQNPPRMELTHLNAETLAIHQQILKNLQDGKWPQQTSAEFTSLQFELRFQRFSLLPGWELNIRKDLLSCNDYKGEIFTAAFGDPKELPHDDRERYAKSAEELRDALGTAAGVFVVIDAVQLQNEMDDSLYNKLFNLLRLIEEQKPRKRVAVIFTKMDEFAPPQRPGGALEKISAQGEFEPSALVRGDRFTGRYAGSVDEAQSNLLTILGKRCHLLLWKEKQENALLGQFEDFYPTPWNLLKRLGAKFFFVASVRNTVVGPTGEPTPPKHYRTSDSDGILEPVQWMLNLECLRSI